MAEFISRTPQSLAAGDAVAWQERIHGKSCNIIHHEGSPIITLRGTGCFCKPNIYRVMAHVVLTAAGATAESIALAVNGNIIPETTIAIPAGTAADVSSGSTMIDIVADVNTENVTLVAITPVEITSAILIVDKI